MVTLKKHHILLFVCLLRLTVRTADFHSTNRSSILLGDALTMGIGSNWLATHSDKVEVTVQVSDAQYDTVTQQDRVTHF